MEQTLHTISIYAFFVSAALVLFLSLILNLPAVGGALRSLFSLLSPFVYGFVVAYILNPVLRTIEKKLFPKLFKNRMGPKARRMLGILLAYLFLAAILFLFFAIVIPQVASSVASIGSKIPAYLSSLDVWMRGIVSSLPTLQLSQETVDSLVNYTEQVLQQGYAFMMSTLPQLIGLTTRFTTGVVNFIVGIIISVYMLSGKDRFFAQLKKLLYAWMPQRWVDESVRLAHSSNRIFSGFIMGKLLDSFIIGILCFIGLTILRMPYAMLVSVIVGVTNVIPYFGPFIGAIPSWLIIFIEDPLKSLWFLIFILVLQQFDGNILGPRILGDSTGLSAFWVIFSIMLFGGLFGFVGMFIGVPSFAVIYNVVKELCERRLKRKGMPQATSSYASDEHQLLD